MEMVLSDTVRVRGSRPFSCSHECVSPARLRCLEMGSCWDLRVYSSSHMACLDGQQKAGDTPISRTVPAVHKGTTCLCAKRPSPQAARSRLLRMVTGCLQILRTLVSLDIACDTTEELI